MSYVPDEYTWFDRGTLFKAAQNADETEFMAMLEGATPLEIGMRDDVISDEHHADLDDGNTWQDEEAALDAVSGALIAELDRRAALLGDAYPFRRINSSLRYVASETLVYEFCLAVSIQKNLSTKPFNKLPILFELISAEAARSYLGDNSQLLRTGWPSHSRAERPTSFSDLLALLKEKTGEFHWSPRPLPPKWRENAPKDEGVDFVIWKSFQDQRLGSLFMLGQCACGADWENKLTDLERAKLERWMNPVTWVDFVKAFAIPHHIPGHRILSDISSRAGLTFDRVRLVAVAQRNQRVFSGKFREAIEQAITHVLPPEYA